MKKIDTEKSTIFGVYADGGDGLKLGIRGYFSHYSNFETYTVGDLDGFTYDEFMSIQEDPYGDYGNQWYEYFIPEDKAVFIEEEKKEKQYRALTIDEFLDRFNIGEVIVLRSKVMPNIVCHIIFDGYIEEIDKETFVILGLHRYPLKELFSSYEYFYNGRWVPFGVKVEG